MNGLVRFGAVAPNLARIERDGVEHFGRRLESRGAQIGERKAPA